MILPVILIGVGISITFLAGLFILQTHLVYHPDRTIVSTPKAIGLSYEDVTLKTKDGVKLKGWFIPAKDSRRVVLFCHGNAGNISHRLESIRCLNQLKLSVFIFDYRGYGESEGSPTETGTYTDAEAAWQYLTQQRQLSPDQIILFGRSLGGSIAAWLAQKYTPSALILESTFTSIIDLGKDIYPFLPINLLSRFKYNTQFYLKKITCPVLIVHSFDDELIPYRHGRKLFETAHHPKEFLELSGDHNNGFIHAGNGYVEGVDIFISECLEGTTRYE